MATKPKPKPITITITSGCTCCGTLVLDDKNFTLTEAGAVVTWDVAKNTNIKAITKITPESKDLFKGKGSATPAPVNDGSKSWQGTISSKAAAGSSESYTIEWKDFANVIHSFDPKIRVNPNVK